MIFYDFLRSIILPLDAIDKHFPPKGKIFDLGCGDGITSKYLTLKKNRLVIGVDKNAKKLPKKYSKKLKFIEADIRYFKFQNADGVLISDVLHHLDFKYQKRILGNVAKSFNQNGTLIIKEIDKGEFVRSRLSRFWDFVFYPSDKIFYWRADDLKQFLNGIGFKVKIQRTNRLFPGSTTLFICKK